jgi:hypothetical protein
MTLEDSGVIECVVVTTMSVVGSYRHKRNELVKTLELCKDEKITSGI